LWLGFGLEVVVTDEQTVVLDPVRVFAFGDTDNLVAIELLILGCEQIRTL